MRKNTSIIELEKEYDPKNILMLIEESYNKNYSKLHSIIGHKDSPINNYSKPVQMSFLDSNENDTNSIIEDIMESLKDAVYFFTLSKKERTNIIQRLRAYETQYLKLIIERLTFFITDVDVFTKPEWYKTQSKSNSDSLNKLYQFCEILRESLVDEEKYLTELSKTSYLTAFQVTMSDFFVFIKNIGMTQKDQITLVQNIFDGFKVDWDEGDRENIRISLQQPAMLHNSYKHSTFQSILMEERLKNISSDMGSQIKELILAYRKFIRRF